MKKVFLILFGLNVFAFNSIGQSFFSADSLKKHVYFFSSDSLEGRGLGSPGSVKVASYIANHFETFGISSYGDSYLHPFYHREGEINAIGNNVIGIIEGSDPILKEEYILLGAHYDHIGYKIKNGEKVIYNGADDNATGTAAVIELGRELAKNKQKLKRSVILVGFDGEESGLIGSRAFVNKQTIPLDKIKVMYSIDMVGRYGESSSLIVGAMETVKDGGDLLLNLSKKHNVEIKKMGKEVSNRTDSKFFGRAGIPSFHITTGIIGPYHKPEDDAETIDYEGMAKVSTLLYDLTIELSNKDEIVPIRRIEAQAKNNGLPFFRFGLKANIGTSYHKYPDEFYNGKKALSAELGVFSQLKINNNIAVQPELLYSTLGSDSENGAYRNHSLTVPVSLVLATSMNQIYDQRMYILLGGYYSYNFSGTLNSESVDYNKNFEEYEYGLSYGIGIEVMKFHMCITAKYGLSDLLQENSVSNMQNRAVYLTIGSMF